jgi:hypothetical protein
MMDDLFNNVNVYHKGRKISIAQHWDSPSDKLEYRDAYGALFDTTAAIQEVAIIPDDGSTWDTACVKRFGKSLTHLIKVLEGIRDEIDQEVHNKSSGKSDARTAQTATGSAT